MFDAQLPMRSSAAAALGTSATQPSPWGPGKSSPSLCMKSNLPSTIPEPCSSSRAGIPISSTSTLPSLFPALASLPCLPSLWRAEVLQMEPHPSLGCLSCPPGAARAGVLWKKLIWDPVIRNGIIMYTGGWIKVAEEYCKLDAHFLFHFTASFFSSPYWALAELQIKLLIRAGVGWDFFSPSDCSLPSHWNEIQAELEFSIVWPKGEGVNNRPANTFSMQNVWKHVYTSNAAQALLDKSHKANISNPLLTCSAGSPASEARTFSLKIHWTSVFSLGKGVFPQQPSCCSFTIESQWAKEISGKSGGHIGGRHTPVHPIQST